MKQATSMRRAMCRVMRDSFRMYFAPLTGAFKGIRAELKSVDLEIQQRRMAESQSKKDFAHHA